MRSSLSLLLLVALTGQARAADEPYDFKGNKLGFVEIAVMQQKKGPNPASSTPIPNSWSEFKSSSNSEDKRIVAMIEKMKWWEVCRDWGREIRSKKETRRLAAFREFLVHEDFINGIDLTNVRERKVAVGMTSCGVQASLGAPDSINYTTSAQRTGAQIVYRSRGIYVYTEAQANNGNGIVRTVQH